MCYKEEKHKKLSIQLEDKLKDIPDFIADFFDRYKSAATKNCNWGYIRDLLQWLVDKGYIVEDSIYSITKEDMNKVAGSHIIKYLNGLKTGAGQGRIRWIQSVLRRMFSVHSGITHTSHTEKRRIPRNQTAFGI